MSEQYCKDCYELQILKGQCFNVSASALNNKYNPDHEDYPQKLYELAKRLFIYFKKQHEIDGKKERFLEW